MAFGAVTLLGWTLFGGLDLLNALLFEAVAPPGAASRYGVALFAAVVAIEACCTCRSTSTPPSASRPGSASTA
jgi:hypothetical protein